MSYKKIHQIRIDFNVTEETRRYVFVYIIEAEDCYMIDSGVYGSERQIASYMESIGRKISDIKKIFLTHAHPDHIGSAAWFRENVGCEIYAGREERRWIEDIDLQFSERPIPNFYILAGRSTKVDHVLHDGDEVLLEEGLSIRAYRTAGHSAGEMSYRLEDAFFIGDTVPVITDIPGIRSFYPAWDHAYSAEEMKEKLEQAEELIMNLGKAIAESDVGQDLRDLTKLVSEEMKLQMFSENPLFAKTVGAFRKEWK